MFPKKRTLKSGAAERVLLGCKSCLQDLLGTPDGDAPRLARGPRFDPPEVDCLRWAEMGSSFINWSDMGAGLGYQL